MTAATERALQLFDPTLDGCGSPAQAKVLARGCAA
jgi:hypothetical protein